jgi:hypothetical protein
MKQRLYRDICPIGHKMFMDRKAVERNVVAITDMMEATGPAEIIWPGFNKVAVNLQWRRWTANYVRMKCARNRLIYT